MAGNRIFVSLRPAPSLASTEAVRRWLRVLIPAVVMLATPAELPADAEVAAVVISIDAEEVRSGPLALAAALTRGAKGLEAVARGARR